MVLEYNREINSDQLCREIRTLLAQINVEYDTHLELLNIETCEGLVTITLSENMPGDTVTQLDVLMAEHSPQEEEVIIQEYEGNDQAKEAGLTVGTFYRTGEFVKVVF